MLWLAIILGCGSEPAPPVGPVTWFLGGPDKVKQVAASDKWPSIAVSESGALIAARTALGEVHVFEEDGRRPILRVPSTRECTGDDCPHNTLAFLDEERLAVLTYGRNMRPWYSVWHLRDREQISFGDVGDLEAHEFDRTINWQITLPAGWNTERVPILLDLETGRRYFTKPDTEELPFNQALSPDGRTVAWSDDSGYLHLSSSDDWVETKVVRVTPATHMKVSHVQWSPSGESILGVADGDALMVYTTELIRRFGLNVKHPPKVLHAVDEERILFWTQVGLFCVNTLNGEIGDGWGKALGSTAFASVGDRAWVNIGKQGVISVDLDLFCPPLETKAATEGGAPTSH